MVISTIFNHFTITSKILLSFFLSYSMAHFSNLLV
uniref:Uncharacterized protein n=1 Tax=Anguilla anguilla TaxID=7936 RepID=A0A0E9PD98_ANGAN